MPKFYVNDGAEYADRSGDSTRRTESFRDSERRKDVDGRGNQGRLPLANSSPVSTHNRHLYSGSFTDRSVLARRSVRNQVHSIGFEEGTPPRRWFLIYTNKKCQLLDKGEQK